MSRFPRRHWTPSERLAHFSVNGAGDCRLWTGSKNQYGYGQLRCNGRRVQAHRLAWEIENGSIPDGFCVCHRCDTPACINVDHLFLGTNADNMADKVAKGRQLRGESHSQAKVKEDQAREIYEAAGSQAKIAAQYGVSDTLVYLIKKKKRWAYIHAAPSPTGAP